MSFLPFGIQAYGTTRQSGGAGRLRVWPSAVCRWFGADNSKPHPRSEKASLRGSARWSKVIGLVGMEEQEEVRGVVGVGSFFSTIRTRCGRPEIGGAAGQRGPLPRTVATRVPR